ncbi:MAG: adenylyl-sulfate kinase [Calditrichaeota bacterium]|nr:MAG: adenylyl-sulfate kinase [Calditrichota bacterium]
MFRDSKLRTILKTISWRFTATATTVTLVYLFTGQIQTAIEVGLLEMVAKMVIYYLHERGWEKLKFGKEEIPAYVVWITGMPYAGKTTLGDMLAATLEKDKRKIQRLDSHTVRALFPETGYSRDDVNRHIKRVGHLASILEKNGIIVFASFVSPYKESRQFVRQLCRNYVEVHLESDAQFARQFDRDGFFEKIDKGEIRHVPGVDAPYERCDDTELWFDMRKHTLQEVHDGVLEYIRKRYN